MPPYCRGSKHQKNGLAPLEERKRLCDPPNLPNLISFICLFPINMQPLALFLRKEPGGLSSISRNRIKRFQSLGKRNREGFCASGRPLGGFRRKSFPIPGSWAGTFSDGSFDKADHISGFLLCRNAPFPFFGDKFGDGFGVGVRPCRRSVPLG